MMPRGRPAAIMAAIVGVVALGGVALALSFAAGMWPATDAATGTHAVIRTTADSGDDPRAGLAGMDRETTVTEVRWWSLDDRRWRTEIEYLQPPLEAGTIVRVSDGEHLWWHDERDGTYARLELPALPAEASGGPLQFALGLPIGPAGVDSVEALADRLRTGDTEVTVTTTNSDTSVIEYRPLWRGSSSSGSASGGETTTESSGGVGRITVDTEHMWITRHELDGGPGHQSALVELVEIERNVAVDDDLVRFDPPAGAREVETDGSISCGSSSGGGGGPRVPTPEGLLRPEYVPQGYVTAASGSSGAPGGDCDEIGAWVLMRLDESDDAPFLLFEQRRRADGIPEPLRTGDAIQVADDDGFRVETDGVRRVTWRRDGIVAVLESDTLSFDELERIAASAAVVPEAGGDAGR